MPIPVRLHRSELCVPGTSRPMLEKAPSLGADVIMLDLEDAVAPDDKPEARDNVIAALQDLDWESSTMVVRINGLDTQYCYRDVVDVVEQAGRWLDTVLIPKAACAADIHMVATLLSQIEDAMGIEKPIGISALIETAPGMHNVDEIAESCPERMEALIFGVADYAASIQSQAASIGGSDPNYATITDAPADGGARELHWGDQWHYPLSRIAVACRANGLRPIDGPFGDFNDPEGYLIAAKRAAVLGYEGKWCIHPSQIELANEVFSPGDDLVDRTRRIVAAMEEAAKNGSGAVSLDGRLIDAASLRMAAHLLHKMELIEERRNGSSPAPVPVAGA
ncbi:MAG: putative citrate lyase, beta subunit [Solirubrobacterales bacterium]|nr:putative citrate lyase, beta subunit [Solirubrobacterales bacterium]